MVMVNNQPTDCCGLAFAGSSGPLETHLACIAPTCRVCNHSKLGRGGEGGTESPILSHRRAKSWLTLEGCEVEELRAGGGAGAGAGCVRGCHSVFPLSP